MNIKIAALLKEYQAQNKIVGESFFKELISIVVKENGLEDYVQEIFVIPKGKEEESEYQKYMDGLAGLFGQAGYEAETKRIVIYEKNIHQFRKSEVDKENISDTILGINALITQSILHELEHAYQKKQVALGTDMESSILKMVTFDGPESSVSYDYSPFERLAEIHSIEAIMEVLSYLPKVDSNLFTYLEKCLKETYQKGYDFRTPDGFLTSQEKGIFSGPFEQYILYHGGSLENTLAFVSSLDDSQKLLYGLTIPWEEYQEKMASNFSRKQ